MKSYYNWLLCGQLLVICAMSSCSGMNDLHDKYLANGEIIYTMKVDSAQIFAGENRVLLRYYTTDPKAKKLMVYWNLRSESKVFDIPNKNVADPVDVYIENLEEGSVYFELYTLNENMQNKSVPYNVDGNVYGRIFKESLVHRKCVVNRTYPDQNIRVSWLSADPKVVGCEIRYTNLSGETINLVTPVDETETIIYDMTDAAEYLEYRTMYRPEPDAVDVFFTTDFNRVTIVEEDVNITANVMTNTTFPFTAGEIVYGSYAEAVGWTVSSNLAPNGNVGANYLQIIAYSGESPVLGEIPNAKLYQTIELDAGKYKFSVFGYGFWGGANNTVYVAAALGDELPDTDDTPQEALAFAPIPVNNAWTSNVINIEFTLTGKSTLSLGFVGNLNASMQLAFREKFELWWIRSE